VKFTRILLKLSGEALMSGDEQFDHQKLSGLAQAVAQVTQMGVQVGVVIGAGNLFRARSANLEVVDRVTADNVGMLATVMNAAIFRDYLRGEGLQSRVLSPREQRPLTKSFARDDAMELMNRGHVLIFAGGTGNPCSAQSVTAVKSITCNRWSMTAP
jgi:uridylate kinase